MNKEIEKIDRELFGDAFVAAEQEVNDDRISGLKEQFKSVLRLIEEKKKEKDRIEEEIRILKADLEDMKTGKFEKIQERQDESPVARNVSPVVFRIIHGQPPIQNDWYTGTFNVACQSNGEKFNKIFYF